MKKFIANSLAVLVIWGLCFCGVYFWYCREEQRKYDESLLVAFANESFSTQGTEYRRAEDFADYHSQYGEYSTYTYFSALGEREQLIYRIWEYAFDNCYDRVFFDSRLTQGCEYAPDEIEELLALDSPLIEQNVNHTIGQTTFTFKGLRKWEYTGQHVGVDIFTREKLEKKLEAVTAAGRVVSAMPAHMSDREKAEYIYAYLRDNITFTRTDEQDETVHYLWDALCKGQTQCDGYANAFSLLAAMADVDCVEKQYTPQGETGHTWNSLCLDGVWYNLDSGSSNVGTAVEKEFGVMLYFCYSDSLQANEPDYSELAPPCRYDLFGVDCRIATARAPDTVERVATALRRSSDPVIVVIIGDEQLTDEQRQQIANKAGYGFRSVIRELSDGSVCYHMVRK